MMAPLALGPAACAAPSWRLGPIGPMAAGLGPLGPAPRASLAIAAPVDARPAVERRGRRATREGRREGGPGGAEGHELAAEGPGTDAARALGAALRTALSDARVARAPRPGEAPDYTLSVRLEHLYVTRYLRPGGARGRPGGADAGLVYGNAGLRVALVEGGAASGRAIVREYVGGACVLRAGEPSAGERARRVALERALAKLARSLGGALDRLGRGPSVYRGPARSSPPPVFLVERVSRTRELLETLYVDTAAASVLRHEVTLLPDPSYGRPGEWLLARRSVEGLWLPDAAYQALARTLDPSYDLRALDDAERYHFFGPREAPARPPPAEARPASEPSPPPAAGPAPPQKAPGRRPPKRRRPARTN
ncbi:MAG TPA: hypothetical protein VFS43_05790 [Polyangiaceae bacterium]|nr:hypothetical protein [Polyangiaceae bacterium]